MDRLDLNFKWFVKTQKGETRFTFRWRGKTDDHTLTSGMYSLYFYFDMHNYISGPNSK